MATVLKVSSKSNPNKVAGALAGCIREEGKAELQTIGTGALNQVIKSYSYCQRVCSFWGEGLYPSLGTCCTVTS